MIERQINAYLGIQPNIQPYKDNRGWRWMNVGTLHGMIEFGESSFIFAVPDGFTTDGATIPRWVQALFNPYDPSTLAAAMVHDWLTPTDAEIAFGGEFSNRPIFPQTIAAGVFYELMRSADVPMLRRRIYYYAVVAAINRRFW